MKIVLAPNKDLAYQYAKDHPVEATVEAEYGEAVIPGSLATLAHHGSRAGNPAPCNDESIEPIPEDSTILISHIDLDTLGGIMALEGEKPRDAEFWRAAGYIDVAGTHHIHELSDETQDKLNAFYAYSYENRKHFAPPDKTRAVDVTAQIESYKDGVVQVLDPLHPLHEMRIDAGREWEQKAREDVENCLVQETDYTRVFSTDGPFCGAAYYSRDQDKTFPAIVSYNEKFHSISISFEDGGKDVSAQQIAKALGVGASTWARYKNEHQELREVLKKGRLDLCLELKSVLIQKAKGMQYMERKQVIKDGIVVAEEVYTRSCPPDVAALHLLLKNYDPEWRNDDKITMDLKKEQVEIAKKKAEENAW